MGPGPAPLSHEYLELLICWGDVFLSTKRVLRGRDFLLTVSSRAWVCLSGALIGYFICNNLNCTPAAHRGTPKISKESNATSYLYPIKIIDSWQKTVTCVCPVGLSVGIRQLSEFPSGDSFLSHTEHTSFQTLWQSIEGQLCFASPFWW